MLPGGSVEEPKYMGISWMHVIKLATAEAIRRRADAGI
jgi:hypothetical protein